MYKGQCSVGVSNKALTRRPPYLYRISITAEFTRRGSGFRRCTRSTSDATPTAVPPAPHPFNAQICRRGCVHRRRRLLSLTLMMMISLMPTPRAMSLHTRLKSSSHFIISILRHCMCILVSLPQSTTFGGRYFFVVMVLYHI